jgi:hypothetical protein
VLYDKLPTNRRTANQFSPKWKKGAGTARGRAQHTLAADPVGKTIPESVARCKREL